MKILFPSTNRVHQARQRLLLNELAKNNQVKIVNLKTNGNEMGGVAASYAVEFHRFIKTEKPDLVIIRGDRYEQLPLAMIAAYNNIPIAHIEGFDLSGVIDNKVRYAISYLSDYHFVTNEESYRRAMAMGFKNVWNFGSLDCEYALSVQNRFRAVGRPYLMALYHPIANEDSSSVFEAISSFHGGEYDVIGIKSNSDYGKKMYNDEYSPGEFIRLLQNCSCLVGNSSAGIKEAGALGIPVVNIGDRQANRLRSKNIKDCKCEKEEIEYAINYQLNHKYEPAKEYYQEGTSKKIAETIEKFL